MNVISSISSSSTPNETSLKAISAINIRREEKKQNQFLTGTQCAYTIKTAIRQCQLNSKCAQISYQNIWIEFNLSQILRHFQNTHLFARPHR